MIITHSSQFQSLCSTKSSSEMLENLPYFIYKRWQIFQRFAGTFHRAQTLKLGGVDCNVLLLSSFVHHRSSSRQHHQQCKVLCMCPRNRSFDGLQMDFNTTCLASTTYLARTRATALCYVVDT